MLKGTLWQIKDIWPIHSFQAHNCYLDLPSFVGCSKMASFQYVKSCIWQQLQGWKEKFQEQAGRELLIEAVAQALPTFIVSCIKLPKLFCKDIEHMFAKFWWGQCETARCIALVGKICVSPKCKGGLGFRDLEIFNLESLEKQGRRLINNPWFFVSRF